jgi:hypothetical protein
MREEEYALKVASMGANDAANEAAVNDAATAENADPDATAESWISATHASLPTGEGAAAASQKDQHGFRKLLRESDTFGRTMFELERSNKPCQILTTTNINSKMHYCHNIQYTNLM